MLTERIEVDQFRKLNTKIAEQTCSFSDDHLLALLKSFTESEGIKKS